MTEGRIVRRDHAIAVRERRNQVTEHVRRGGKAVQQQDRRRIRRARLAIEDVYPIDFGRAITRDGRVLAQARGCAAARAAGGMTADSATSSPSIDIAG